MDSISLIISSVVAVAFIINAIVTYTMNVNRDRRNNHRLFEGKIEKLQDKMEQLQDKMGQLQDKMGQLQIVISEIKIELSQIRKGVSSIEARQLKMEKEIDTLKRNSEDKRLQIGMIEAHRQFSYSPQMLEHNQEQDNPS